MMISLIFFLTLVAIALSGIGFLLVAQLRLLRDREADSGDNWPTLAEAIQPRLDHFYSRSADLFISLGHHLYYFSLLGLRHIAAWSKVLLHRAEQKFSRLIDSVRGKGVLNKKGAVSLFLTQLTDSK